MNNYKFIILISIFVLISGCVLLEESDIDNDEAHYKTALIGEYIQEGTTKNYSWNVSNFERISDIGLTFHWTDDSDAGIRYENLPDNYTLEILIDGKTVSNETGNKSDMFLKWSNEDSMHIDNLTIRVHCLECGDQEPTPNILNRRSIEDNGNDFNMRVEVLYFGEEINEDEVWIWHFY